MSDYCSTTNEVQKRQKAVMKKIRKSFAKFSGSGDIIRAENKKHEKKMNKLRNEVYIERNNLINQNQQAKLFLLEIIDLKEKVERSQRFNQPNFG